MYYVQYVYVCVHTCVLLNYYYYYCTVLPPKSPFLPTLGGYQVQVRIVKSFLCDTYMYM